MQQRKITYTLDNVAFRPRETELVWTLAFPADAVFTAVEQAARRRGLRPAMASREHGLLIARPPLSLFTVGRKVVFALSALSPAKTRVKAQYQHGAVIFQSRESRLDLLDTVLRTAHMTLDSELEIRSGRGAAARPEASAPVRPAKAPAPRPPVPEPAVPEKAMSPAPAESKPAEPQERPETPKNDSPLPQAPPAPDAAAPETGHPDLSGLDFGRLDWNDIPLEPPPPEDFERYRRAAGSRRLSMGVKLLWLVLGVGIFFGLSLLAGMLGQ